MLDIEFIREHVDKVRQAAEHKQLNQKVVDEVLRLDKERRDLIQKVESIKAKRNDLNDRLKKEQTEALKTESVALKRELQDLEPQLKKVEASFHDLMLQVPSIPAPDVPVGQDETGNQVHKTWGEKPQFDFPIKDHVTLGENLDLIDLERGVKIGGFRSYFTKNDLVLLEQAVLNFALNSLIAKGFTPMTVPWIVNDDALWGTGYFPWGIEDHFQTQDGQKLIGTAEVSLTAYRAGEILSEKDLPVKLVGISPCFRREVGSHGKDTKGIFRVHQFTKVEQVVLCHNDEKESIKWHEALLKNSEEILQALKLPYQVMLMCTGDMGAGQVKKYDIETWFPGQNKYRETHSDSYFLEFQARRLNIRYKTGNGETKFVHTLNNTVAATPRLLTAIMENYQQQDGSIKIPQVLQEFVGKEVITTQKAET
ncbi:MAG: serine--tRNA ligase [Candidatus Chisholmbacteria bacterium]|nr:serine--tRNA ligase [Candidatus Chisholmbacteria bacterium]